MAEYVNLRSLESALKIADSIAKANGKDKDRQVWARAIRLLNDMPTADVAPVVHGRWIGAPLCGNDNCRCSACGSWHNIHVNLRGETMQKYCPECGAKMDRGDSDEVN